MIVRLGRTIAVATLVSLAAACSEPPPPPSCKRLLAELRTWTTGWRGKSAEYCDKELGSLQRASKNWGTIQRWQESVYWPSLLMLSNLRDQASRNPPIVAFSRFPQRVTCEGLVIEDGAWKAGPLGRLGLKKPERIFAMYEIESLDRASEAGTRAYAFRMWNDFNCDGRLGSVAFEGSVDRFGAYQPLQIVNPVWLLSE